MSCELYDEDLRPMDFSDSPRCVYERSCPFANSRYINKAEAAEGCQAIADERKHTYMTAEDIEQETILASLTSISRVN